MLENLKNRARVIYSKSTDPNEKRKYSFILGILEDENCFLKMPVEQAYQILKDLKIPTDKRIKVLTKLTSIEAYNKT